MAHGWSMRETGGFVAAGLPVSAGGLMPRTALLLVGRAGRGRGEIRDNRLSVGGPAKPGKPRPNEPGVSGFA